MCPTDTAACPHCCRVFTLKPAGQRAHMVYPHHNVTCRASRAEPLPARCTGSGLVVRVMTDAEADAVDAKVEAEIDALFTRPPFA